MFSIKVLGLSPITRGNPFVMSFLSAWIRILKVNDDKILPFWDPRLAGRLHHHGTRPVLLRGTGVLAPHLGG